MDTELASLVERAAAIPQPGPFPPPAPRPGQSDEDWRDEVQRIRHRHDAAAVESYFMSASRPEIDPAIVATHRDVPVGGATIGARVYTPPGDGPFPAILVFHGGAWWMGGGATGFALNDRICRNISVRLGAVVANVDYRLAPEHRYPTQLEDGYAVLQWISHESNVDPDRIGLLGMSSGGNLAAGLSLLARDRGHPTVRTVALLAPFLDLNTAQAAYQSADPVLREAARALTSIYFGSDPDADDPLISPLRAPDLAKLPPTVICVGEFDPLRDHGQRYVAALQDSGVEAVLLEYPATHTVSTPSVARQSEDDLIAAIAKWL